MNPTIKNHSEKITGYKTAKRDEKGFYTDGNGSGKKTYFKAGDIIEVKGDPVLCQNGIHFFRNPGIAIDYFYDGNPVFKVESMGEVQEDTEKSVTIKLKIVKKLTKRDYKKMFDDKNNSGNRNSGNRNSGNRNSGNGNSGNRNSGDRNSGDGNSGNRNSGDGNSGYGYLNFFCIKQRFFLFDIEVKKIPDEIQYMDWSWLSLEKKGIEGYKEAWSKCPKEVLDSLKKIPQFKLAKNKKKFFEITGVKI